MSNGIQNLSPLALVALNQQMATTIGSITPNLYGVPTAQVTALTSDTTALVSLNTAVETAKAAYHAAVQNRENGRAAAAAAAAQVARTVYANPAVTTGMIAALGLSPRSTSRARLVPLPPSDVVATPSVDGTVLLKWARGGNGKGVAFLVEAQVAGGAWAFIGETTAARTMLSGYAPGVAASFRIVASNGGVVSAYSPVASIYPASAAPALRLAA